VGSVLEVTGVTVLAVVAGWRLCLPRSSPRQRIPAAVLLVLAVATLANLSGPADVIDRLTGIADAAVLAKNTLVLVALAGAIAFVPAPAPDSASTRGRLIGYAATVVAIAGMVALFATIPRDFGGADFVDEHAGSAAVAGYGLLYQLCFATDLAIVGLRLYGNWRRTPKSVLRIGLLLLCAGVAAAMVYIGNRVVFLTTHVVGIHAVQGPVYVTVSQTLLAITLLPLAVGCGLGAGGVAARWVRDYRSLQQLYGLWRDLVRAVPDIALYGPPNRLVDSCMLRAVRFRLYRRIIEIRDAQWALQRRLPTSLREDAVQQARRQGLPPAALNAAADACVVEIARRVSISAQDPPVQNATARTEGGTDLDGEVDALLRLAAARRTAFVRQFVATCLSDGGAGLPDRIREPSGRRDG
jgi:hypothetical protein